MPFRCKLILFSLNFLFIHKPEKKYAQFPIQKILGSIEEQEFFGEVLFSIKQVIQNHLHDVQVRFLDQFNVMQNEIKNRDLVINELHTRINELELGGVNAYLMNSPIDETRMSGSGSSGDIAFVVSDDN